MRIPHPGDPFRSPSWRHERCVGLLDLHRKPSRRDDLATWRGWDYLAAVRCARDDPGRERVQGDYPDLDAAHRLRFHGEDLIRFGVEGYLLGGVVPSEVDDRFRLVPGTALAYAEQFFDVLHCLNARDYLVHIVIKVHARPLTVKDAEVFLRLHGLLSGRFVVDSLLDYYAHPLPVPLRLDGVPEEERRVLLQRLHVHTALLTDCLSEGGGKPWTWELLTRLADRLAREAAPAPSGVQVDVSAYLAGMDPATLEGLGRMGAGLGGLKDAA